LGHDAHIFALAPRVFEAINAEASRMLGNAFGLPYLRDRPWPDQLPDGTPLRDENEIWDSVMSWSWLRQD